MSRYFDAKAALSRVRANPIRPIHPIPDCGGRQNSTNSMNRVPPNADAFEERAAIAEFDGGMTRDEAEAFASNLQGYDNVIMFKAALKNNRKGDSNGKT